MRRFDAIIAVNPRGPFLPCRGGARGRIINITSQRGMVDAPGKVVTATPGDLSRDAESAGRYSRTRATTRSGIAQWSASTVVG